MKPSFRSLIKSSLPALIIVPGLASTAHAQGNTILPNPAGDVVVSGNYDELNGADWTVLANGGTSGPFSVNIEEGALLTGASYLGIGVDVSVAGYTVTNAGILDAWQYGIYSSTGDLIVNNLAGARIEGGSYGILFSERRFDEFSQTLTSPLPEPVAIPEVNNDGEIRGNNSGIYTRDELTLNNGIEGIITGSFGNGITVGSGLTLDNQGIITGGLFDDDRKKVSPIIDIPFLKGTGNGVYTGDEAKVTNSGTIIGKAGDGIFSGNKLTLNNSGSIVGEGRPSYQVRTKEIYLDPFDGDGVYTGDDAAITNETNGSIMGIDDGIDSGRHLTLNNSGTITGSGYAGVNTLDGATITNSGTIDGSQYGVIFNSSRPDDDFGGPVDVDFVSSVLPLTSPVVDPVVLEPSSIDNSGTISGGLAGISAADGFTLDNRAAGVVTASNGTALLAGNGLTLNNHGSITGVGGDGLQAGNETSITNGGSITANAAEVEASSDEAQLPPPVNSGVAVRAGDDAVIENLSSGSISGISHGIIAGANLHLTNAGTITASHDGQGHTAVLARGTASITNSGQISGDSAGIRIDQIVMEDIGKAAASSAVTSVSSIANTGTISGGTIGISVGENLTITNGKNGLIEAVSGDAIQTGNQLVLSNRGRILGGTDGKALVTGDGLKLRNEGAIRSTGSSITSGNDATITNLADAVIQGGLHAIMTGNSLVLENAGKVTAKGTAVNAGSGTKITNDGSINGDDWAIVLDDSPALIENVRKGLSPADSETPIIDSALPSSIVNNGTIESGGTAISGGNSLTVENNDDASISAGSGIGVVAGDSLKLDNSGTIRSGGVAAVFSGDKLTLENFGSIIGNGDQPPVNAKLATFGTAIFTGDDATITNHEGAEISGKQDGISAGRGLTVENHGEIRGNASAIHAGDGLNVINLGTIVGETNGLLMESESIKAKALSEQDVPFAEPIPVLLPPVIIAPQVITNYGTIKGTTGIGISTNGSSNNIINHNLIEGGTAAISLGAGDDSVYLNLGSTIQGDIDGGSGVDELNFFGGLEKLGDKENIVHGNVSGIESITKSGSGFAFIGGVGESFDVEADRIEVESGGLVINGNLSSQGGGKTEINLTGGQLEGTGEWNADLVVADGGISAGYTVNQFVGGVLPLDAPAEGVEPVYSIGTFIINGDVTHNPVANGARAALAAPAAVIQPTYIRQDIAPQTPIIDGVNSDTIVQNGAGNSYDVTGVDVRIAPTDINKTLTDGTYTVIDSDSALIGSNQLGRLGVHFGSNAVESGRFQATQTGLNNQGTVLANYFAKLTTTDPVGGAGSDSNLVIEIDHNYAGLPGLSEGEAAFGAALDAAAGSANPIVQDFIAALDYSDLGTVQNTLSALDPSTTLGLVSSVVDSNYRLHRLTQNHLASIRGQGASTETAQPAYDAKGAMVPGETSSITSGLGNAWGSISYDGQDYDAGGTRSDFDGDSGSFTAGVDWRINDKLVLGLVLDGTRSDQDGTGFSSDIDSLRAAVYGTWGEETGFYSDFLAGYGDHSIESTRNLGALLGGISNVESDASSLQALLTAGYTMAYRNLKHGPFAGLEYQNVDVDGFNQGGILPLTAGDHEVDSLRALIGYRVDAEYGKFRPYASVAYAHEFEDGTNTAPATFAGVPFSVSGEEQSSALLVTAGTGIALTTSLTLDIGYRGDIATDDGLISHGGSIGLNFAF